MLLGFGIVDALVFYGIPMGLSVKKVMLFGTLKILLGF